MSRLGRRELERWVDGKGFAELLSALSLAVCRAMNEGEVLVRARELLVAQALADRALEALRGGVILSRFILLQRELEGCRSGLERNEDRAPYRMAGLGGRKVEV